MLDRLGSTLIRRDRDRKAGSVAHDGTTVTIVERTAERFHLELLNGLSLGSRSVQTSLDDLQISKTGDVDDTQDAYDPREDPLSFRRGERIVGSVSTHALAAGRVVSD